MLTRPRSKVVVFAALALLVAASLAAADTWTPNQYKGPAYYRYKVTMHDGDTAKQMSYALDIQPSDQETTGDPLLKVTTTLESTMTQDDLTSGGYFGANNAVMFTPFMLYGNPLFATAFDQLDLKVGEKMSLMGMGLVKVVQKETHSGVEGYLCELSMKKDGKEAKVAELVVSPDLALPLRSRTYDDDGNVQFEMELVEYKKH